MTDTTNDAAELHGTNALSILQKVRPPFVPSETEGVTFTIEYPPGHPGAAPHRHPGPAFGYVLEGEMRFELEGEPVRVIRAGEAFWEPGGDVIHYQDGNHSDRTRLRFLVTLLCPPDAPMLTFVDENELAARRARRVA